MGVTLAFISVENDRTKRLLVLLLCLGVNLSTLLAQRSAPHQDPPGYLGSGLEYYRGGAYEIALTNFESAIKKDRKNPLGWYYAGLTHFQLQQFPEGIKFAKKSIRRNKTNPDAWHLRGRCEAELKRYRSADKSLTRSLLQNKENPLAWAALAKIKVQQKKLKDGITGYSTAIQLSPMEASYYAQRAEIFLLLENAQPAINDCQQGLQYEDRNQKLYFLLAQASLMKKDSMAALRNFTSVIDLDSLNAPARLERAKIARGKGLLSEALHDLNLAIKSSPECQDCLTERGINYLKSGNHDKALQDFMDLMALDEKDGKAQDELSAYYAAVSAFMTKQHETALYAADRAIHIDRRSARAYWIRADIKKALGDVKGAEKDRKKAGKWSEE